MGPGCLGASCAPCPVTTHRSPNKPGCCPARASVGLGAAALLATHTFCPGPTNRFVASYEAVVTELPHLGCSPSGWGPRPAPLPRPRSPCGQTTHGSLRRADTQVLRDVTVGTPEARQGAGRPTRTASPSHPRC